MYNASASASATEFLAITMITTGSDPPAHFLQHVRADGNRHGCTQRALQNASCFRVLSYMIAAAYASIHISAACLYDGSNLFASRAAVATGEVNDEAVAHRLCAVAGVMASCTRLAKSSKVARRGAGTERRKFPLHFDVIHVIRLGRRAPGARGDPRDPAQQTRTWPLRAPSAVTRAT